MKDIKCYIIDDESYSIDMLTDHLKKVPELKLIGTNTNPLLAVEEIKSGKKPDLVFLDINMPQLSGFEVASLIPKDIAIIFVTGYMNHAYDAFENNGIDFILKPYTFDRFAKAVQKAERLLSNTSPIVEHNNGQIFIKSGSKNIIEQVSVKDIVNIEACDHYVFIHTRNEKSIVNLRMGELEDLLPATTFVRIHRTHIVNVNLIKSIDGNKVYMINGLNLPLSKSYKDNFIKKIKDRMIKSTKS